MIKLELPDKPAKLTDEKETQLVAEYQQTGKAVWRESYITQPLLEMTHSKCAFSEQLLNTLSAYMEVDHFKCIKLYADEVVRWGNLLPICKKCNTTKGGLDVCNTPIINPLHDNPKDYLYVKAFRYYPKNMKGDDTITATALNDRDHFETPRYRIGEYIAGLLEANWDVLKSADAGLKQKAIGRIKKTLSSCRSENSFSAVLSTYVLYELPVYKDIENHLRENGLWDDEFEEIKNNLLFCALPPDTL